MKKLVLLILTWGIVRFVSAQVTPDSDLYKTIRSRDSLLFDIGFNTCNISQFESLLSERFEFFHDIDSISDKKKFLHDLRNGLCGNPGNYQARRELIPGTTQIFALRNKHNHGKIYGAIQHGVHQFFEKQPGQKENFGSSARFTHIWLLENGEWKLSRAFSYEHVPVHLESSQAPSFDNEAEIEKWLKENNVPAVGIGIIKNSKLQQVKVFGEIASGVPAPYNTIFNVASLTKPVTAIITLKLVSAGKWSLDEPIYTYWTDPDLADDPRVKNLTTRHILSHQTGFPNWRRENDDQKLHFLCDPGTKYRYSGEGFEYLRKALEKKFGKTLQELADEYIFQPLKMQDSRYIWDEHIDTNRLALGFNQSGIAYPVIKSYTPNAADDLMTTIEDYGKFLVSVLQGRGLSETVFKDMMSPQVESSKGKHFGLGFEIYNLGNGEFALSHGGSDSGVQTIVFILPKTGQGLLIFTNSDAGVNLYEGLLKHYLGDYGQKIFDIETK